MTVAFAILAALTIAGTVLAMTLRNLVHCVLALIVGLAGLAAIYLDLGAQFVGLTQVLVYVGAVAILAIFAIMLTRSSGPAAKLASASSWLTGSTVAGLTFAVLAWAVVNSSALATSDGMQPETSVSQIGIALMHRFVLPLEIIAVLLTAALIGAGVLAMDQAREAK
jgi:NADH-quinone oxidoreductase subunit J